MFIGNAFSRATECTLFTNQIQLIAPRPPAAYLHVPLRLHKSTHDAKAGPQLSSIGPCCHAWYNGVVGALAGGQSIRMRGV